MTTKRLLNICLLHSHSLSIMLQQQVFSSLVVCTENYACPFDGLREARNKTKLFEQNAKRPCEEEGSYISEEIFAMIVAWEACDLSANTPIMERNDTDYFVAASGGSLSSEPPRRILTSSLRETLPCPSRFHRKKNIFPPQNHDVIS